MDWCDKAIFAGFILRIILASYYVDNKDYSKIVLWGLSIKKETNCFLGLFVALAISIIQNNEEETIIV